MVRNKVHDTMAKPAKQREHPQDKYLNFEQLQKGERYTCDEYGELLVVDKKITSTGDEIAFVNRKGKPYTEPLYASNLKIKA